MVKFKKYKFKEGDTVEGVLRGMSNLSIEIAKQFFYETNEKKNFKMGDEVLIPVFSEEKIDKEKEI